jgi:gliding motility-associated-like protein
MLKKGIVVFIAIIVSSTIWSATDATVSAHSSPSNGCNLTSTEVITVSILNSGTSTIFGGSITANYSINGGAIITEPTGTSIGPSAVFTYSFATKADLSACGTNFTIKVWISLAGDSNPNNDTLTWVVRNDCTISPGNVVTDETVCFGSNSDTLNLTGWINGTISNWLYSDDAGATWNNIANTTTTEIFNNLTTTRIYKVAINGGYCSNDTSGMATITVQTLPIGGTLAGPDSLCISVASGTITLSGNNRPVTDWQYSTDNGVTWTNIGNTSTTENFASLTQTTDYRAQIDGGVCPSTYSDTQQVYIEQLSTAGVLLKDTTICENTAVSLLIGSSTGTITDWESSSDGITWNPLSIPTPSTSFNTGNLISSTYYRVEVKNGICPMVYSNPVYVQVQAEIIPGTMSGDTATCASNASGTLLISGNTGGVLKWQNSIDYGATWIDIGNTTTSQNYTSLAQTTWYRALIDGGVCTDRYTDTSFITVFPVTSAGLLNKDTTICEGDNFSLLLTSYVGNIVDWQYSTNLSSWASIGITDSAYTATNVLDTTYFRVFVKSGVCIQDTSNYALISTLPLPNASAGNDTTIYPGASAQLNGSGGNFCVWLPGASLSDSSIYNPIATPTATTTYTLGVIDGNGCRNYDKVVVTVASAIPPFDVKNVMTPNKDGFNDTWMIQGVEAYPSIEVEVYNIYGQQVYQNKDYKNEWSGEYKGKALPNGTYLYIVTPGGTTDQYKGNLTILGDE